MCSAHFHVNGAIRGAVIPVISVLIGDCSNRSIKNNGQGGERQGSSNIAIDIGTRQCMVCVVSGKGNVTGVDIIQEHAGRRKRACTLDE